MGHRATDDAHFPLTDAGFRERLEPILGVVIEP